MEKILVWDWPVRLGHWTLAIGFAVAWLTAESERFRLVHVVAGGAVLGVATFRLVWGVLGTRYARFGDFIRGPQAVVAYLKSVLAMRPIHHVGHNPAGGWAIMALLLLGIATSVAGYFVYNELGGHLLEEFHEALASLMLGVVFVHLAGVAAGSLLERQNLPRSMLTGYKTGTPGAAIASARAWSIPLLLLWIVALTYWLTR